MDVQLGVLGSFILYHVRQIDDVYPPGGYVGGDQEPQRAGPHAPHHLLAGALAQVGADLVGIVTEPPQHGGHIMHADLRVAEDQRRAGVLHLDDPHQRAVLLHRGHIVEYVLGIGDMHVLGAEAEDLRLVQELACQADDPLRERGREHRAVYPPAARQIALNLFHVRVEAHRQHAVGFIEDERIEALKIEGAAQQVVEHTAWSADDKVRSVAECLELRPIADPAVYRDRPHAGVARQQVGLGLDLLRQLARRRQHQCLALRAVRVDAVEHRQHERARLAAAGVRLHHYVAPGEQIGHSPALHGHQARPSGPRARLLQRFAQAGDGDWGELARRFGGPVLGFGLSGIVRLSGRVNRIVGCRNSQSCPRL